MIELLPCPFCGSDKIVSGEDEINWCATCGAQSESIIWNTRHSPWVSVKSRLPEIGVEVLVSDGRYISTAYMGTKFISDDIENITHWMPLPQPPKETE